MCCNCAAHNPNIPTPSTKRKTDKYQHTIS
jgi:hypothetical protein